MKKKSILIIGATGFIGKHLVEALPNRNNKITCLIRKKSKKKDIDFLKKFKVNLFYGDLKNKKSLERIDNNLDTVIYLAGGGKTTSFLKEDFDHLYDYNVKALKNFLDSIKNMKRIIFVSSISAMGIQKGKIMDETIKCTPYLPHEKCKFFAEKLIKKYSKTKKYRFIILRPSIVYGERGFGDTFNMIKMINKGFFFMPGNGKNITPWVYVKNVVEAIILLIRKGNNETYIINNNENLSFNEIIKQISKNLNKKIFLIHLPVILLKPLVFIQEKIFLFFNKTPPLNMYRLDSMTSNRFYSIKKIKEIGYKQKYDFKESLIKTISWYKDEDK